MKRFHLILLLLFFIICSSFAYSKRPEGFASPKEHIRFMKKKELNDLIANDEDNYLSSLGKKDLAIRNAQTMKEYKLAIKDSFCEIDETVKSILTRSCLKVDKVLKQGAPKMLGIDLEKMSKLDWNIGCTCDDKYENGYPHTRGEVIILPLKIIEKRDNEQTLCRLLLHEKVHIYQKAFKKEVEDAVTALRFQVTGTRTNDPANPDVNEKKYSHPVEGEFYATYQNNPKKFSDIKYANDRSSFEHPYEWIAYEIEKLFS